MNMIPNFEFRDKLSLIRDADGGGNEPFVPGVSDPGHGAGAAQGPPMAARLRNALLLPRPPSSSHHRRFSLHQPPSPIPLRYIPPERLINHQSIHFTASLVVPLKLCLDQFSLIFDVDADPSFLRFDASVVAAAALRCVAVPQDLIVPQLCQQVTCYSKHLNLQYW
jgi:hypothetical protein